MGFAFSTPPPPAVGAGTKFFNFFKQNGKGVIGSIPIVFLTLILIIAQKDLETKPEKSLFFLYIMMFTTLLIHPVAVPVVAFVPLFAFPLLHIMESSKVSKAYMCSNTFLMIIGGFLHQMVNASGWDKRFALWMIFPKNNNFTATALIAKSSTAAFFLSMITSRMHATKVIMAEVVGSMREEDKSKKGKQKQYMPNKDPLSAILANSIATSSTLGSLAIVQGARNVMFMRSIWEMSHNPDTFNFLDYTCFALPLSLVMFSLNLLYYIAISKISGKNLSATQVTALQKSMSSSKSKIPKKLKAHECLTLFFTFVSLMAYFTRWSMILFKITKKTRGWADGKKTTTALGSTLPDVTVAALITIICCILPSSFNFINIMKAKTESQLPPKQADSAILYWKFVDKNTSYGYMFLVGAFCALWQAMSVHPKFALNYLKFPGTSSVAVNCLLYICMTAVLSNIMTSVAVTGMLSIIMLNSMPGGTTFLYQNMLAIGLGSSLGFTAYFKYTPMYFVRTVAGITRTNHIMYSLGSVIICMLILWVGVFLYAPIIFAVPPPPPLPEVPNVPNVPPPP